MKNWAVIDNGIVSNVIVWDGVTPLGGSADLVQIPDTAEGEPIGIGASFDGETWTPWTPVDPEPTPEELAIIEARQSAIAKLEALGLTVDEVQVAFGLVAE